MNPEQLMDNLMKELTATLKAMSKAKTVEEKVLHSQVVKNLSESLGVFLNLANNIIGDDFDDFYEND